jgi:hypothetical protein
VHEGTEVQVALTLQKYLPFVRFETLPVASAEQINQLVAALQG